jgi:hypothetical protein
MGSRNEREGVWAAADKGCCFASGLSGMLASFWFDHLECAAWSDTPRRSIEKGPLMAGSIERLLTEDHSRLDALLARTVEDSEQLDLEAYRSFRAGLLKHISMEEKILLPGVTQLRGGQPLPIAGRLRLDHGAIAALLVPSPTPAIVEITRSILARHNRIEEGAEGLYATCDRLLGDVASVDLMTRLRTAPEVPVSAFNDGPKVIPAVCRALRRGGYDIEADRLLVSDASP